MVKYGIFEFEELDVPDHWVAFPSFGQLLRADVDQVKDFRDVAIHLSPNEVYQVSMDQSTSNTGIFIKNYTNTRTYMIEVTPSSKGEPGIYIYNLEQFLHQLFEGCTISHVIYERPIKSQSYQSARVLFQLEGMIQALPLRYPEFRTVKLDAIENASWRSVVIQSNLGTDNRKQQSRISVQRIFDWTQGYGPSLGHDQDIFEAIGVMMGWFYVSFDAFGRPYVRGPRSQRTIGVLVLPGISGEQAIKLLKDQGIDAMFEVENPRYSIMQNLTTMVERYKVLCVEFTTPYTMLSICIESNLRWEDYDYLTCILTDAACVDPKLKEIMGGEFQFVI